MASVNKAIIIGNLGKDPEVRYTASGEALCNITVATSETWKDKKSACLPLSKAQASPETSVFRDAVPPP